LQLKERRKNKRHQNQEIQKGLAVSKPFLSGTQGAFLQIHLDRFAPTIQRMSAFLGSIQGEAFAEFPAFARFFWPAILLRFARHDKHLKHT